MPVTDQMPQAVPTISFAGPAEPVSVPRTSVVIVAAGRGQRLGAPDKVFLPLAGRPILAHVLDAVSQTRCVREIIVVIGEHTREAARNLAQTGGWQIPLDIVTGGERRQDSVAAGVAAVGTEAEVVLVHDGARPLVEPGLIDRCAAGALETGAAIAAVPISDTLKRVASDRVVDTVARENLWAAQTPQAFRRDLLIDGLKSPLARSRTFTDEAALFEALGLPVAVVQGSPRNVKITHPDDLHLAAALLAQEQLRTDHSVRAIEHPQYGAKR